MGRGRALLYCTYNGVCSNTNGIGRQTKTLLSALEGRFDELSGLVEPFDVHLACPAPSPRTWGYDPDDLAYAEAVVRRRGGRVHSLPYDLDGMFWSVPTWQALSDGAARLASSLAEGYRELLVVAVDTPFAGVGRILPRHLPDRLRGRVQVLLTLYSTARIVEWPTPDPARIAWEQAGIASANTDPTVWVADIGAYLTSHLQAWLGLDAARLVPCRSSLDLTSPDLAPMPVAEARQVAAAWGVPLDRPVVLAIGRTDPMKGADLLIDALRPLRDQVHLVLLVTPFDGPDPLVAAYAEAIDRQRLRATFVPRFSRVLPRALASLDVTRVVACPSRDEPLANVPFEVALWARHAGPIVVAPRHGGFVEQLTDGETGLLYDPARPDGLTGAIRRALALDPATVAWMRQAAFARVAATRDIVPNLAETLRWFGWQA